MEGFIKSRVNDRRFGNSRPVDMGVSTSWVPLSSRPDIHSIQRVNASMGDKSYSKEGSSEKPKKKKAKTTSKKGSDAGSVTSDGTDNGTCWSNYERNEKPKGSKGSCEPKSGKKRGKM